MNDNNIDSTLQKEYTFPGMMPSSQCHSEIEAIKKSRLPHIKAAWVIFGLFITFFILTVTLFATELSYGHGAMTWIEVYMGTIIFAVLCGITIVAGVVNIALMNKNGKGKYSIKELERSIKANNQYSAFIVQGFDAKDAYKLTLEWLDRQAIINK